MDKMTEMLLGSHGIKPTPNRIMVLEVLLHASSPMSMTEIADELETVDKSNVSRILALFRERRLVHSFEAEREGTLYEVCHSCGEHDSDIHVHFRCSECHTVYCFDDVLVPPVQCPAGFEAEGASYVLSGLCPKCRKAGF